MNATQLEITNLLFRWNLNKPAMPRMKLCTLYKDFEKEYEKFQVAKRDYLQVLDAELGKYPIVRCEMHEFANREMENHLQEITANAHKLAIKQVNPILSDTIYKMHTIFHSMLATQEQALALSNGHRHIADALFDIKNEALVKSGEFVHSANLYACEMLDTVFQDLMDLLDKLEEKNKENKRNLLETCSNNIAKYESLSAGLGLECNISVIAKGDDGYCYIKDQIFDMTCISDDFGRIWSLL